MAFDKLAVAYDNAIDWELRLNRELPLLLSLLTERGARVLDLACGSGRHATALAMRGFQVVGLDNSRAMIESAIRHTKSAKVNVDFFVADMIDAAQVVEGSFDLVICLGNSLALLPNYNALEQTLAGVGSVLREGGAFVAQILNFEEVRRSGYRFFPIKSGRTSDDEEVIFVRFFESVKQEASARLVLASFVNHGGRWRSQTAIQQVLQLDQVILRKALQQAGFPTIRFYSGYDCHPLSPVASRNIVAIAIR